MTRAKHAQVVIVGAGPGGAALGYLLAKRGVRVSLIERSEDFAREFRGEVLMPSGVDALRQMGLGEELDRLPQHRLRGVRVIRNERKLMEVKLAELSGREAEARVVSQPAMLDMLVRKAGEHERFEFTRGRTIKRLIEERGRICGVAAGEEEYRGELVVGADGRVSAVRRLAGMREERQPVGFDIVWFKSPAMNGQGESEDESSARVYLKRGHVALVIPIYGGQWQIGWLIEKGRMGELRTRGMEEWVGELAAHIGGEIGAHLRAERAGVTEPFLLSVVCDRLERWTKPGVLLIGDAAHPMSPVGGQGINMALRDAIVAANELEGVLKRGEKAEAVDAACERVRGVRIGEIRAIQRIQHAVPRMMFERSVLSGAIWVVLPWLVRTGIAKLAVGRTMSKLLNGVNEVRLRE